MAGFGSIHDLAEVELRVRRTLQEASHQLHSAHTLLSGDGTRFTSDNRAEVKEMVARAKEAISRVIGD